MSDRSEETYAVSAQGKRRTTPMVNFRDASDWKPWQRGMAAASKVFGLHNVFTTVPCSSGSDGGLEAVDEKPKQKKVKARLAP